MSLKQITYCILGLLVVISMWGLLSSAATRPSTDGMDPDILKRDSLVLSVSARKFDQWFAQRLKQRDLKEQPIRMERGVMGRVQKGLYVPSSTIMEMVSQWRSYEELQFLRRRRRGQRPIRQDYQHTLALIDRIMGLLYERAWLRAMLHREQAKVYGLINERDRLVKEEKAAHELLHELHLRVDEERVDALVRIGQGLRISGKDQEAEKYFRKAKGYPWFLIRDPNTLKMMKEHYAAAVSGLIASFGNDVEALRQIIIAPAMKSEFEPVIEQAIEEAKRFRAARYGESEIDPQADNSEEETEEPEPALR